MSERRKKQKGEDRSGVRKIELEIGCLLVPLLWGCVTLGRLLDLSESLSLSSSRKWGWAFLLHRVEVRIKRGHGCVLDRNLAPCTQLRWEHCFLKGSFSLYAPPLPSWQEIRFSCRILGISGDRLELVLRVSRLHKSVQGQGRRN